MVELCEIMPNFLESAELQARHVHFARTLMSQIHGEAGDPTRAAFIEGGANLYGMPTR